MSIMVNTGHHLHHSLESLTCVACCVTDHEVEVVTLTLEVRQTGVIVDDLDTQAGRGNYFFSHALLSTSRYQQAYV